MTGTDEERTTGAGAEPTQDLSARLTHDEARLSRDETRLAEDEERIRRNRLLAYTLAATLALTVLALVLSVIALNRDIEAVAKATPKDGSVSAAAIQDGAVGTWALADGAVTEAKLAPRAVTASRLAAGSVSTEAIGERAVTAKAIADGAVTGRAVAADSLGGADIDESTLAPVPRAKTAGTADDAAALGGVAAGRFLSRVTHVTAETQTSTLVRKGPVTATCPSGTVVVGGGARVDGARDVALSANAPYGTTGWTAEASAFGEATAPWKVVVTAVCARGG